MDDPESISMVRPATAQPAPRAAMSIRDVRATIRQIAECARDPEHQHGLKDALFRDVLMDYAYFSSEPELALEALKAEEAKTRWEACA